MGGNASEGDSHLCAHWRWNSFMLHALSTSPQQLRRACMVSCAERHPLVCVCVWQNNRPLGGCLCVCVCVCVCGVWGSDRLIMHN